MNSKSSFTGGITANSKNHKNSYFGHHEHKNSTSGLDHSANNISRTFTPERKLNSGTTVGNGSTSVQYDKKLSQHSYAGGHSHAGSQGHLNYSKAQKTKSSGEKKFLVRNLSLTPIKNFNVSNMSRNLTSSDLQSTVRRSEYTEREKKLMEKLKQFKSENKKLVSLLKESEKILADKLKESKTEQQKLNNLFKVLWPSI